MYDLYAEKAEERETILIILSLRRCYQLTHRSSRRFIERVSHLLYKFYNRFAQIVNP